MPSPKAIAIANDRPIDLLVTHIEIRNRIAIRCDLDTQTPQEQYIKDKKRAPSPNDSITTYIFGRSVHASEGSYCVEVPYSPTCYMRVPDFWESMATRIPNILSHLLTCLIGNAEYAKPYAKCLTGKFVRMLHAFGYRPEPHYLYLKIDCSNRYIYNKLRSLLSSNNTFRRTSYQSKQFYARFLTMGFLSTNKIRKQGEVEDLIRNTHNHWYTKEWFVCHEFLDDKIAFLKSLEMEINGFVRVSKGTLRRKPRRGFSNAANEIVCKSATDVHGIGLDVVPKGTLAGIVKMSFDIECASHDIVNHPHHDRAYDKVSQIGTKTGSILDPQHAQRIVFTLGKPSPSEKCTYRTYAHETGLLVGFAKFIVQHDVDIFNTFNGLDFDWDYLHKRACLAMFCQSSSSFVVALARWEHMHEQYQAYMPLQKQYTKLSTKFKKREDQEKPEFRKKQHILFTKMAAVLEMPASKRFFRQPTQDPYKQAIWSVSSEAELRKFFDYFNAQPSIVPWFYMHRMRCTKMGFDIRPKSSAAMGNQLLKSPNDGRTNSDMFLYIKTSYAMDSYGLNACADKFLKNQSKDDLLDHYKQHKDELDIQLRSASSMNNAYRMMYEYVASDRPELIKAVCEYCDQDVEVTDQLDAKLGTSMELVSMMKRYRVILQALTRRAQQYRFMTNVSFEILNKFVFNSYDRTAKAPTYQGAAVLPPTWGLHGAPWEWVFCLDFASLYPTIMRERSFCIRSFILPCDRPRILALVRAGKHPPIMAVPYSREYVKGRDPIIWINKDTPDFDMNSTALFAIMKTKDTILPRFLERMGNDRNAVKKEMKVTKKEMEKHPEQKDALAFKHMVLDSEQKAIKIGMNSVYGSLGVKEGTITGLQEIAMSVTYCGRMYIFKTRDFCYDYAATTPGWEDLDLEIVYGDSVTGDTALVVRHRNKVRTIRIDELHLLFPDATWTKWHGDKECLEFDPDDPNTPESWSTDKDGKGTFVKIRRLIRHTTKKAIHRVLTHTGIVDCTSDHSLLRPDGTKVKPTDVQIKEELLHVDNIYTQPDAAPTLNVNEGEAFVMGLFVADGSCGKYGSGAKVKRTWAINNADRTLLEKVQPYLRDALYCPTESRIYDTMRSSHVYKLNAVGSPKTMVDRYRHLFYNQSREKRIPEGILFHPDLNIVKAFWDGFYTGDGDKHPGTTSIDQKGKEICTGLWILAKRLGHVGIAMNARHDKPNIFRLSMDFKKGPKKNPTGIKKNYILHPEGTQRMVYDLEMADDLHRFHVGPGKMVVHNTDSVFPKIRHKHKKPFDIKELWKKVEVMADTATRTLYNPPHNLELEYGTCKIAWFYEIDKKTKQKKGVKKRYISWKFMKPDMSCGKLSANGVEIKRRGSVQFVRTVYQAIVDSIWKNAVKDGKVVAEDTETTQRRAIDVYKKHLVDMENKQVPLEEFVYSRGLTSHPSKYKNQATPHVQCALQEIKAFNEGRLTTCPQAGDRVKFVPVLRTNMKKRKASECVVSAKLFDPKKDTLDRKKVIDDLVNPLSQVMQSVMLNPAPMAIASARKCRAYDSRQSMIRDSGASAVKFEKCVIVSPPKKKVKANKDIRSFFKKTKP